MKIKMFKFFSIIVILGIILLTLAGCGNENNSNQNTVNDNNEIEKKENNDVNNISVLPTIDIEEIDLSSKTTEKEEVQLTEDVKKEEDNSTDTQKITEIEKKDDVETTTDQRKKFNVGKFEYEYGTYKMSISDAVIDGNLVFPDVFVEIKKDGTYVLTSDYQNIIENHTGTWNVNDSKLYLKHGNETIEYQSLYNNCFVNKRGYLEYKEQ